MADRKYRVALENPVSDECEKCGLKEMTFVLDVPSVTTVSKARGLSWNFIYSAVSLTKQGKDFKAEWGKAADRGTLTHDLAEDIARFGLPEDEEAWIADKPEEIQGFAKALLRWWRIHNPKMLTVEFPVVSLTHKFAGRADAVVLLARQRVLIDFKTVKDEAFFTRYPKSFEDNRLEVVARLYAMREMGLDVDSAAIVRLGPQGGYHHYNVPEKDEQKLFDCFLRARAEWDFKQEDESA